MERGAQTGAGFLAGLVTPQGAVLKDCAHGRDSFLSSLCRTVACGKDTHWGSLWRTIFHEKHPTLEQGKSMKSPLPEDKDPAEKI